MAKSLFFRNSAPAGPRGQRAYAIGDVHGCLDLLESLLARIESEIAESPRRRTSIVFLGDLIDRGPASAQVIERLRTYRPAGAKAHFIMGNHEEVMLRVLAGETGLLSSWLKFGGVQTLNSYGLDVAKVAKLPPERMIAEIRQAVPTEHIVFLHSFADSISFGGYLFVHAGIRPGIDLAEQSQSDLRWIREPFLDDPSDHGFVVVHGHTITSEVEVTPNRIGIDTGAFCTGTLTALAIDGRKRWLIRTSQSETERV
ncbi:MAG TPA: metallophosphoesterase family protein [Sphingomicrobium sp.]|nr:metallophosphoesterase family protein [Sphingomicrobium sp.]